MVIYIAAYLFCGLAFVFFASISAGNSLSDSDKSSIIGDFLLWPLLLVGILIFWVFRILIFWVFQIPMAIARLVARIGKKK